MKNEESEPRTTTVTYVLYTWWKVYVLRTSRHMWLQWKCWRRSSSRQ